MSIKIYRWRRYFTDQKDGKEDRKEDSIQKQKIEQKKTKKELNQRNMLHLIKQTRRHSPIKTTESNQKKEYKISFKGNETTGRFYVSKFTRHKN